MVVVFGDGAVVFYCNGDGVVVCNGGSGSGGGRREVVAVVRGW